MSAQIQDLWSLTPDWISDFYQSLLVDQLPKISLVNVMHTLRDGMGDFYESNPSTSVFLFAFMLYYLYYVKNVVKKPELICSDEGFKQFLEENCPIISEEFKPTIWCAHTHMQSVLGTGIRAVVPIPQYRREFVPVDDYVPQKSVPGWSNTRKENCVITLDWYDGPGPTLQLPDGSQFYAELLAKYNESTHVYQPTVSEDNGQPIAIFLPGLTGDSRTEYIRTAVRCSNDIGYKTCVFNNRSRGGMRLKTPRLYNATNYDDLEACLKHIKLTHPNSKVIAVGISLGGIVLCKYLAERGEDALVDAAMLVSVCFDFEAGCKSLEEPGFNNALNLHLTRSLLKIVDENKEIIVKTGKFNMDEITASKNLKQFDERFTRRMWLYDSVEAYHKDASNKDRLHLIRKPTLCINAADDVFCPYPALPLKQIESNPRCAMLVTARGGHIGFMDSMILMPSMFYLERLIIQYLGALKDKTKHMESYDEIFAAAAAAAHSVES